MLEQMCENCRFVRRRRLRGTPRPGRTGVILTCHRNPPLIDGPTWGGITPDAWPGVSPGEWCGEWRPAESIVFVRRDERERDPPPPLIA